MSQHKTQHKARKWNPVGHDDRVRERLKSRIIISGECWEYRNSANETGYGAIAYQGRMQNAARVSYVLFVGTLPYGYEPDHLCRNRACVRPDHLEGVPKRVNILRGESPIAKQARQTHCKNGHEFTPENTIRESASKRKCRECRKAFDRRRRATRKNGPPGGGAVIVEYD
jgi:hypothetical protein